MELITRRQDVEHACYIPGCSLIVHPRTDSIGRPEFMHRNFLGMRIQPNGGNIRKLSRMVLMHAFGTRAAIKKILWNNFVHFIGETKKKRSLVRASCKYYHNEE